MTSARNQFTGEILQIETGRTHSVVTVSIGNIAIVTAEIPNAAVDDLRLGPGILVFVIIKASMIVIIPDDVKIKASCQNRLRGTITDCIRGAVNGIVKMDIGGGKILTAVITNETIEDLNLKMGKRACALINGGNVIIAVGD